LERKRASYLSLERWQSSTTSHDSKLWSSVSVLERASAETSKLRPRIPLSKASTLCRALSFSSAAKSPYKRHQGSAGGAEAAEGIIGGEANGADDGDVGLESGAAELGSEGGHEALEPAYKPRYKRMNTELFA
ncbi:unnamed protein product, partial [Musa acuminata subsp. burmannicoides]